MGSRSCSRFWSRITSARIRLEKLANLGPNHKALALYEAPAAEAVRDFLYRGGFANFLDPQFPIITPIQDLVRRMDAFPTIY